MDCTLPAGVIVKAPGLRKRYIAPRTQLRNPVENPCERSSRRIKKSIDIKGKSGCELQESWLVRVALFDVTPRELGRLGKISGLITVGWCGGVTDACA